MKKEEEEDEEEEEESLLKADAVNEGGRGGERENGFIKSKRSERGRLRARGGKLIEKKRNE